MTELTPFAVKAWVTITCLAVVGNVILGIILCFMWKDRKDTLIDLDRARMSGRETADDRSQVINERSTLRQERRAVTEWLTKMPKSILMTVNEARTNEAEDTE